MNGFELNKLFAAVLVAGLVAMMSAFIAGKVVHPEKLEKSVYIPEGVEDTGASVTAAAEPKGPTPISPLLASADPVAGQKASRACVACHSFEKGGANKVGPNLYDIVGNGHAHIDGFSYSKAMVELKAEKWGYEELNAFLYQPKVYIKGTKMAFAGIKNDQERANLIAWLRTLSDSPKALPQ